MSQHRVSVHLHVDVLSAARCSSAQLLLDCQRAVRMLLRCMKHWPHAVSAALSPGTGVSESATAESIAFVTFVLRL
jgi:hypothetical protein